MSGATEVERLITALGRDDAVARDAAIARLRVIGSRAVDRLAHAMAGTAATVRRDALKALEGIDDRRTTTIALAALQDPDLQVRISAIGVLRGWLVRESGTAVLDSLSTLALDRGQEGAVRLVALDALSELPRHIIQPILEQAGPAVSAEPPSDDPASLREWLAVHGDAPLSTLHDLIATMRQRERDETATRRRQDWLATRGAAHAALARRGSRVALYDLREAFDAAAAPLPLDFLAAVVAIGDVACLEPMARAWAASPREQWWRQRLSESAAEIVRRLGLTRRSAALKRVRDKWPGFLP